MKPTLRLKRRSRLERMQASSLPSPLARSEGGLKQVRGKAGKAAGNKVRGQAEYVVGRAQPYAVTARDAVAHRASEAWEWAEPRLEHATETVQKDIAPRVSSALNTAAERSAPAREEALERGTAAFAALKGVAPQKQKRRWPLAMLFFLIGGALGAAAGIFGQRAAPTTLTATGSGFNGSASGTGTAGGSASTEEQRPSGGSGMNR